jgi:FkbM family methyltransferase
VIGAARRAAALPPFRRILKSRHVEPIVAELLRASPVRERLRFVLRQLRRPGEPCVYSLRSWGARIVVRHGTPDVAALGEVFYELQYEPPLAVGAFLDSLGRPLTVLDLGANVGYFATFASVRFPRAKVVAFEPDASNTPLLRRTAAINGWDWDVVEAAAGPADGMVPFASGRFTFSREEEGGAEVTAVDVMPYLRTSDFVKIDIEGAEWAILGDERFPTVAPPVLVLEHHPYRSPDPDPRAAALQLFEGAGYDVVAELDFGGGQGLVWGLRRTPQSSPAP